MSFLEEKADSWYFTDIKTECLPKLKEFKENSEKVSSF